MTEICYAVSGTAHVLYLHMSARTQGSARDHTHPAMLHCVYCVRGVLHA